MSVFVDTSALYAVVDAGDAQHEQAAAEWERLLVSGRILRTTSYVLLETTALVLHRLGMAALRLLQLDVVPVLAVTWVGQVEHEAGAAALLAADRRALSLADCVSFDVMRRLGLREAFAFDSHFAEQGFRCLPSSAAELEPGSRPVT